MKPIFQRAVDSLQLTIRPNAANAALIRAARTELAETLSSLASPDVEVEAAADEGKDLGTYIGVHIRRGDRKAEAWPHMKSYVPAADMLLTAIGTWERLLPSAPALAASQRGMIAWVASDSQEARDEFVAGALESALIFSLDTSSNAELQNLASKTEYVQSDFGQLPLEDRIRLTRGALVDFAMLGGAWVWDDESRPLASVCTLRFVWMSLLLPPRVTDFRSVFPSSNYCKLAAVTLGWDRAFGFGHDAETGQVQNGIDNTRKRWVELDNKGTIAPMWRAFDMF